MALPVEISDFFALLSGLWFTFPLMVRQIFYLAFIVLGVIGLLKLFAKG